MEQTKENLRTIISSLLNISSDFSEEEEFLKLGADSVFFIRLQVEIKKQFGKRINIKDIFANASLNKLTALVTGEAV
ncbi:MAG: acyl carrier protein [Ruminococcus sp.]|nr:acyl carrier protein [Ruminococcus sp.]